MVTDRGEGLVLQGVSKFFRNVVAVDDLSFQVPRGSLFGLIGVNGAGKTTTLRMILNILRPDRGTIMWGGRPVSDVPRYTFGYLPEERGLYPKMKVGEQLVFMAGLNDVPTPEATRRARDWLERVGLSDAWNRRVEELSKGNQQKVQVLVAILHDPQLMLLDEPFSGLDPINTEVLRDTLLRRRSEGRTVIFSSHRLEQVEELCDRVAIIHRGRLLASGLIADLKRASATRLVELAFTPTNGQLPDLDPFLAALTPGGVRVRECRADSLRLELADGLAADQLLKLAVQAAPAPIRRFEVVEPTLQEIFIEAVGAADPAAIGELGAQGQVRGRGWGGE